MNPIANPDPIKVIGRASECMRRLMEAGLSFDDLQMPITDPEMRKRLVRFWRSGCFVDASTWQLAARNIMGTNFFGIEEAMKHFGVLPSEKQITALAKLPFTQELLKCYRDTHTLVAVFPMSIVDILEYDDKPVSPPEDGWHKSEKFANNKGTISWQLVRKTPVEDSTFKDWNEQQALLGWNEETPSAQVMFYTIIGHYKEMGERLFRNVDVRTSCARPDGYHYGVGKFNLRMLHVGPWRDDHPNLRLGLASARKPNK